MRTPLHIYLLGRFLLVADETPVTTVIIPRVQSLLTYLLLHRHAPQDRSHLAFLLWPDSTEAQAHTNLRQLLYHLRQSFPQAHQFLRISKHSLQWLPAEEETIYVLDVHELEHAYAQAEQAEHIHDTAVLRQSLEQVVHLYQGELFPGCYEEWIIPERDRLRQLFLHATQRLSTLLEEERVYPSAILVVQALLRQDPLQEAAYRQLMRLYVLSGDRAAALHTYHTCVQLLERELEIEPSELTQAAYTTLLRSGQAASQDQVPQSKQRARSAALQGRKDEWRQLQKIWHRATDSQKGAPHLVILSGEAGIGKTRLAQELAEWANRLGALTVSACCYATLTNLAYAPLTSWLRNDALRAHLSALDPTTLRELARLVPEILSTHPHISPPDPMLQEWQRQTFFTALARALLSTRDPLLLLLDDLQWCDQETLQWLHYLFQFTSDARILLLGTVRVGETSPSHPLLSFLGTLQRDRLVTEIPLGPLSLAETTVLAESLLSHQLEPSLSQALYHETEGNPFFIVEMAQAGTLHTDNLPTPAHSGPLPFLTQATSPLPSSVQAVLTARLAQLSPQAYDLAKVAAVIGREFSFPILLHASREDEEYVVQAIDELWQRRIVREHAESAMDTYDFSHDKLRTQMYVSLNPSRRRLLHQRVAEAFLSLYGEDPQTLYGQIATHYVLAGLPAQAFPLYLRAGEFARQIYAHTEAQYAFAQAITLLETDTSGQLQRLLSWQTVAQAFIALGDTFVETGSDERARQAYQQAQNALPAETPLWHARLHWKTAITWICASTQQDDPSYLTGRQEFEKAEHLLLLMKDSTLPEWRDEWIALQFAQLWRGRGSVVDMATAIEKVRPIVEHDGTQEQRKLLLEAIGIHNAMRDRYTIPAQRVEAWRATLAALEPTENEAQRGRDLTVLGIGLLCAHQFDEAEEQLRQALRLGERTGSIWLQNNCLTFLPFIFRRRGQVEEVRHMLAQARSLGITQKNRILSGHAAWLAWRDENLPLAETCGRESLEEDWLPQLRSNPFRWTGRWPLIGVLLTQGQIFEAIQHIRLLFDPTQQPPPEPFADLLDGAIHTWEKGEEEEARLLLLHIVPLAEQVGYL